MKRFILSLFLLAALVFDINAQRAAQVKTYYVDAGKYIAFNSNKADTLKTNDTISYVFVCQHQQSVNPIIDLRPLLVAADTTIALSVFESMDGVTYYNCNYGAVGTSTQYTKTVAKGSTNIEYNGASDAIWFEARYLKLMFISKPKSGFKKILSGYVKMNIR